jgi:hypothetical protein
VTLTSSDTSAATVPATITIPAGKTTATFKVSHAAVSDETVVTITATSSTTSKAASLKVTS